MRIISLDMTLRNTGYSVWEFGFNAEGGRQRWLPLVCGCITTVISKSRDYEMIKDLRASQKIYRELEELLNLYDVRAVVVELLEGTQNSRAAKTFGFATGVLAGLLEGHELPIYAYRAQDVKKTITGRKNAPKEEMIREADALCPGLFKKNGFKKKKNKTGKLAWPGTIEHVADSVCLLKHAEDQSDLRALAQLSLEAQPVMRPLPGKPEEEEEEDDFFD